MHLTLKKEATKPLGKNFLQRQATFDRFIRIDMTITVTQCGRLCFGRRTMNLTQVFAGQNVGVQEVADQI